MRESHLVPRKSLCVLTSSRTFPDRASENAFKLDGVVLDPSTLPGGTAPPLYNQGIIAVHEVGHWLSLFHTFEAHGNSSGGCYGQGDYIYDTPAEASPGHGCLVVRTPILCLSTDALPGHNLFSPFSCLSNRL
jgi:hypothetical protein